MLRRFHLFFQNYETEECQIEHFHFVKSENKETCMKNIPLFVGNLSIYFDIDLLRFIETR